MPRPKQPQSYYDDIKDKFQEERNLRLLYRPPGTDQSTSEFSGDLAKYAVDPYAEEVPRPRADHRQGRSAVYWGLAFLRC